MFIRKKNNKSGSVRVQIIDKSSGKYIVHRTIGSSKDPEKVEKMVREAHVYIRELSGMQEIDFNDYKTQTERVLSNVHSLKLVGLELVLGKIFDEIGFNQIDDELFRYLVLYRLLYPYSKLKTTEYLYRYEQKAYSEDEIYRYMDKLHSSQKEIVQQTSFRHTKKILGSEVRFVFYDVTTLYFEIDRSDDLRKTGFSKEGKHQNPQILLGLLVGNNGYPLSYEIFPGNKYEGHTMLPVIEAFRTKYNLDKIVIVADSGLLTNANIEELLQNGYEFILGARIKNEKEAMKKQILNLKLKHGESKVLNKGRLKLIITYSEDRAKKDAYNREKGLNKLEKGIRSGKLTKTNINNRGYNKFLQMEGEVKVEIDQGKIQEDEKWDGLKGYLSNAELTTVQIIENYHQLWQIEKAFRVTKTDLKIRPIYHRLQRRIEAHICLNFVAYKVYKELERKLKEMKSDFTPGRVIEIIQNIFQIEILMPSINELYKRTLILTDEQREIAKIFNF